MLHSKANPYQKSLKKKKKGWGVCHKEGHCPEGRL